ncbi:MAG: hypothetical protein JWM18_4972, partial [Chloroflexi bacterium]|nr:hypothetical protein [Chloroflexota bacterium]
MTETDTLGGVAGALHRDALFVDGAWVQSSGAGRLEV